jgi:acyl-ACP thioesterase
MKYTKEYLVNSYETDVNLNLKLNSMFQWFTEIAWEHAKSLGVGFEELADTNRIWILSGISLQINKLPKWQDKVRLETWPSGIGGLHYTREFKLYLENGEELASAGSTWVIFDKVLSKPVTPIEFAYLTEITKEKAIDNLFSKIRPRKDLFPSFKEIAKHTDIDMHKHVNNAVYVRWIENCTGDIFPRRINTLKIQYLNEVKLHDEIVIFNEKTENHYYWEARINGDKLCFRAEVGLY